VQIKGGEIQSNHQIYRNPTISINPADLQDGASRISGDTDEDSSIGLGGGSGSLGSKSGENMAHVPEKFGTGNASLSAATGKNVKKKPKSNIAKSNSSFVSRIISHDNLAKRLQERSCEDLMIFANINRAFNWLDMDSAIKVLSMVARFCLQILIYCYSKNPCPRYSSPRLTRYATT
jgi:hypothetical protein